MRTQSTDNFIAACKDFNQAMLVTRTRQGQLRGRPMFIAALEEDGDMWFATDIESGKADDLSANPEVAVLMTDGGTYISISGRARLESDRQKIEQLWSEPWRIWFPEGKSDPHLALINVSASEGEYWSNAGTNRIKYLFATAKAYATGQRPDVDEALHGKVKL